MFTNRLFKLFLNSIFIFGLFSFYSSGFGMQTVKKWVFGDSKEELEAKERQLDQCLKRLQKCVDDNADPDPKDLFDVWYSDSWTVENYRDLIEKVIKIRNLKHKFVEDPSKIIITNPFRMILRGGIEFNYCCPICNGHIYFNKKYYYDYDLKRDVDCKYSPIDDHKDWCLKRILREKDNATRIKKEAEDKLLAKSQVSLSRLQKCVDNSVDPDPEDIFNVCDDKTFFDQNKVLIKKAIDLRIINNYDIVDNARKNTVKCCQPNCNAKFNEKIDPVYCEICLKALYCDKKCLESDKVLVNSHREDCFKNISNEKKDRVIERLKKIRECVDKNNSPDPKDLFYFSQDVILSGQNSDLLERAKNIRITKNRDIIEKAKIENLQCSCCNSSLNGKTDEQIIKCPYCLKTLYCSKECFEKHKNDHKDNCIKFIMQERFDKRVAEAIEKIKSTNNRDEEPDDLELYYASKSVQNIEFINKAKDLKYACNNEAMTEEYKNKPVCFMCNAQLGRDDGIRYCSCCMNTVYCKTCSGHTFDNCLRAILDNKEKKKRRMDNIVNRIKELDSQGLVPDKKDIFYAWNNRDLYIKNEDMLKRVKERINKINSGKIESEFKKNPFCCICKKGIENGKYSYCSSCEKAFYCENCKRHDKKDCIKNILDEDKENKTKKNEDIKQITKINDKNEKVPEIEIKKDIYTSKEGGLDFSNNIFGYRKNNEIEFILLNTIDHTDKRVNSCVAIEYSKIKSSNNTNKKLGCFLPDGTCGLQAIRNSYLISKFLESQNYDRLKDIADKNNAKDYLKRTIKEGMSVSSLDLTDIEGRIGEMDLYDNVIVFNSVIDVEKEQKKEVKRIIDKFKGKNCYHIFVINTADIKSLGLLEEQKDAYQKREHCKIEEKSFLDFKSKQDSVNNWYIIAIDKRENSKSNLVESACIIIDSDPESENQLKDDLKFERNKSLCEFILNGNKLAFDGLKGKIKLITRKTIEDAIENGKLKKDITSNTQRLMTQEDNEMSESLQNSIYKSAPSGVKGLMDIFKIALEKAKLYPTEKAKDHVDYLPQIFILHGPSGTGKSDIARLFAKKTGRRIFFVNCGLLGTSMQYSESENLKNEIFPVLELGKENVSCLVVLDEADALTRKNGKDDRDSGSAAAALASILDACKNYDILFICTTNHLGNLIPKLVDRAKFYIIEILPPDLAARKEIIKYLIFERARKSKNIENVDVKFDLLDLDLIAKNTENFSIRILESIVNMTYANKYKEMVGNNLNEVVLTNDEFISQCNLIRECKLTYEKSKEEKNDK